ncbi:MAG: tetratricopeptide repeat protein [Patescibacteria group bacterium]|nr:tetratricopeptide repeat protein [Patescibacteria group bacterium]
MLNTIAWIIFAFSLLVILYIIIRKFPVLSILDVENIPGEKEAQFKEKILKQRLERDFSSLSKFWQGLRRLIGGSIGNFLKKKYNNLSKVRDDLRRKKKLSFTEKRELIADLFLRAKSALSEYDYEAAEKNLIEIISLDSKRLLAFLDLAESYRLRKNFQEAKATLEHALKMALKVSRDPEMLEGVIIAEIHFSLAWVCFELGLFDESLEYTRQALDAAPNNPRYLDLIFDLSIIRKDKKLALTSWEQLAAANPDNQKLDELKAKIDLLEDKV